MAKVSDIRKDVNELYVKVYQSNDGDLTPELRQELLDVVVELIVLLHGEPD